MVQRSDKQPADTLMVRLELWNGIRLHFSQAEKDCLNNAIVAQVLCPPSAIISTGKISKDLHDKLIKLIEEASGGKK